MSQASGWMTSCGREERSDGTPANVRLYLPCIYINESHKFLCDVNTLPWRLRVKKHNFEQRNFQLHDPWKWLLTKFASCYGVSEAYTKLRCWNLTKLPSWTHLEQQNLSYHVFRNWGLTST